jgi:cobalt/nickel transport system permease protein/cobalt/nickel transport protein
VSRVSNRAVLLTLLLVALVLAGVVSHYASSSPDGLNRVAQDKGFSSAAKSHGSTDGPFAGYATKGLGNDRLSGGLAGIVGSLVVLGGAGALVFAVRRRGDTAGDTAGDGTRDTSSDATAGGRGDSRQDA